MECLSIIWIKYLITIVSRNVRKMSWHSFHIRFDFFPRSFVCLPVWFIFAANRVSNSAHRCCCHYCYTCAAQKGRNKNETIHQLHQNFARARSQKFDTTIKMVCFFRDFRMNHTHTHKTNGAHTYVSTKNELCLLQNINPPALYSYIHI